jgi:large subunit ribosomal protein L29
MKYKEIKELTTKEIKELIHDEGFNYTRLRIAHTVNPLDNPMRLQVVRRTIARLKTELRKRELSQNEK